MPLGDIGLREQLHPGLSPDGVGVKETASSSESRIDFLKGDEIGVDLENHVNNSLRTDKTVRAAAFVDVVGRDFQPTPPLTLNIGHGQPRRSIAQLYHERSCAKLS
jgi:hypothetical protein